MRFTLYKGHFRAPRVEQHHVQRIDWGLIPYAEAVQRQNSLLEEVAAARAEEALVFCTHPPVVTVGRSTKPGDVFGWQGEKLETSRGGRATYHGPSQVVVYPILNLDHTRKNFGARDIHGYLRALESSLVVTLHEFGIHSEARTMKSDDGSPSLTGVWVGEKKIASIGIAVKKWVTYHGLALNVEHDPQAFAGINPCGFQSGVMTSIEGVLKQKVDCVAVQNTLHAIMQIHLV